MARQNPNYYHTWAEKHPFAATGIETVAIFALKKAVSRIGEVRGLDFGNGHMQRHMEKAVEHPIWAAAHSTIYAPVAEELIFRQAIPSITKRKLNIKEDTIASQMVDYATVVGFAAAHIGNPLSKKGRDNLAIPLSPLIGSIHYSSLTKRRGVRHAMVAHAANNALASVGMVSKARKIRQKQPG